MRSRESERDGWRERESQLVFFWVIMGQHVASIEQWTKSLRDVDETLIYLPQADESLFQPGVRFPQPLPLI